MRAHLLSCRFPFHRFRIDLIFHAEERRVCAFVFYVSSYFVLAYRFVLLKSSPCLRNVILTLTHLCAIRY